MLNQPLNSWARPRRPQRPQRPRGYTPPTFGWAYPRVGAHFPQAMALSRVHV